MMSFNAILSFCFTRDVVWFRLGRQGPGIAFKRTPLLFSERHGHRKFIRVGFGWRLVLWGPNG